MLEASADNPVAAAQYTVAEPQRPIKNCLGGIGFRSAPSLIGLAMPLFDISPILAMIHEPRPA